MHRGQSKTGRIGVGEDAARMQQFVNAVRAVLRKDPLYDPGDSRLTETERFYAAPRRWLEDTR